MGRLWNWVGLWLLLPLLAGCAAAINVGAVQRERLVTIQAVRTLPVDTVEANVGKVTRDAVQMVLLQEGIRVLGEMDEADTETTATIAVTITKGLHSYSLSARVVHGRKQEPLAVVTLSQSFSVFFEPAPSDLGRSLGFALAGLLKGGTGSAGGLQLVAERARINR